MADKIIAVWELQQEVADGNIIEKFPISELTQITNCPPKATIINYLWVKESLLTGRTDNQLVTNLDVDGEPYEWRGEDPICVVTDVTAALPTTPLIWLYLINPTDEYVYAKWTESETDPLFPEAFIDTYQLEYTAYDSDGNIVVSKQTIFTPDLSFDITPIQKTCKTYKARVRAHDSLNRWSGWSDLAILYISPSTYFKIDSYSTDSRWYRGIRTDSSATSTAYISTDSFGEGLQKTNSEFIESACWANQGKMLMLAWNGDDGHFWYDIFNTEDTPYKFVPENETHVNQSQGKDLDPNIRLVYLSENTNYWYAMTHDREGWLHTPSPKLTVMASGGTYPNISPSYTSYDTKYLSGDFGDEPRDCFFSADGLTFWINDSIGERFFKCDLTTAFKLSSGYTKTTYNMKTFTGITDAADLRGMYGFQFLDAGHYLLMCFGWIDTDKRGYQFITFHMSTAYDTDNMTVYYERLPGKPLINTAPQIRNPLTARTAADISAGAYCSEMVDISVEPREPNGWSSTSHDNITGYNDDYTYPKFYKRKFI